MSDRTGIDTVLRQAADRGEVPGVVALAGTSQGATYEGAFGRRDLSKPDPMTPDTVFWIASMTKAIVSTAAMQMVERGRVGLDQNLGEILAPLATPRVIEGWDDAGKPRLRPARSVDPGPLSLLALALHARSRRAQQRWHYFWKSWHVLRD